MTINMKEIYIKFIKMESDLDLFLYILKDAYVWERIRYQVFNRIVFESLASHTGTKIALHSCMIKRIYGKIKRDAKKFFSLFIDSFLYNPFVMKKMDFLFIDSSRSVLSLRQYRNIYFDTLLFFLIGKNTAVIECRRGEKIFSFPITKKKYFFSVFHLFSSIRYYCKFIKYKKLESWLEGIEHEIAENFNLKLNIRTDLAAYIIQRILETSLWKIFFNLKKPKIIFVVGHIGNAHIIHAAKQVRIPVVELQHGVASQFSPAYHFEEGTTIIDFPDYLFTFGQFWNEGINYPIPSDRIISIGFPFLSLFVRNYQNTALKKDQMVFLSQGPIGNDLYEFALKVEKNLCGRISIRYKLHPGELNDFDAWDKRFRSSSINIAGNETNLYGLLAESKWVVGVFSTAVYEAIELGCIPFLVDLPGVEHLEPLLEKGYAKRVKYPEEIDLSFSPPRPPKNYFFAENWEENFAKAIQNILEKEQKHVQ